MGKKHDEVKNCEFSKNSPDLQSKEFTYPKLRLVAVDGNSLEEGGKKSKIRKKARSNPLIKNLTALADSIDDELERLENL